jgi:hypothetical protein
MDGFYRGWRSNSSEDFEGAQGHAFARPESSNSPQPPGTRLTGGRCYSFPHESLPWAKLISRGHKLHVVYDAGSCGFGIWLHLNALGTACEVAAPSSIPNRSTSGF